MKRQAFLYSLPNEAGGRVEKLQWEGAGNNLILQNLCHWTYFPPLRFEFCLRWCENYGLTKQKGDESELKAEDCVDETPIHRPSKYCDPSWICLQIHNCPHQIVTVWDS